MFKKISVMYLSKIIKELGFEEQTLEINQDLIENANEEWQEIRKTKTAFKTVKKYIESN